MAVLKLKESIEALLEEENFDMFEDVRPTRPAAPSPRRSYRAALVGVVTIAAVASLIFIVSQLARSRYLGQPQIGSAFALLDVHVLTQRGRNVAGATIMLDGIEVGSTDSFGEWRKFIRTLAGEELQVQATKVMDGEMLQGSAKIVVPENATADADLQLKAAIEVTASQKAGGQEEQERGESSAKTLRENTVAVEDGNLDLSRIWIMRVPDKSGVKQRTVDKVRSLMRNQGIRIDPQSPLRVSLHPLVYKNGGKVSSLMEAKISYATKEGGGAGPQLLASFLSHQFAKSNQTAKAFWRRLRRHVETVHYAYRSGSDWLVDQPKSLAWRLKPRDVLAAESGEFVSVVRRAGDQRVLVSSRTPFCSGQETCRMSGGASRRYGPADIAWSRLRFRTAGPLAKGARVYVSGYLASQEASSSSEHQEWAYWGEKNGIANLTIIEGEKIIHRGKLRAKKGRVPTIGLAKLRLSRR